MFKPEFVQEREDRGLPFDLYFAGSYNKTVEESIYEVGANRLSSQLLDRVVIGKWIENHQEHTNDAKLMIDSGAHTAFYTGQELDVEEYMRYLNSIDDGVHIFVQVDKVPGSAKNGRALKDFEDAPRNNWENYLYMREHLTSPQKLLPVFHIGEDYNWLKNMLEWVGPNGERVPYIGIAPRQEDPWSHKIQFIERCFDTIRKSSNPNVKTHALGMTKLSVLESYPFASADSTSWLMTAAMGSIMTPFGIIVVSERAQNENINHYARLPAEGRKALEEYVSQYGYTLEELSTEYIKREIINVKYLVKWAQNYKYTPNTSCRRRLF